MKRAVGLTTDTSKFNTTLPQTKYLNYFMKTNPVGYANGGDVRAGLPNSNMNVTKGFLPMALGFENGGKADKSNFLDESKLTFQAIINIIAEKIVQMEDFLGMSPNDPKIQKEAEKILIENPEYGEQLIKKAEIESIGGGQSITDTQNNYNSRIPTESDLVAPKDTFQDPTTMLPQAPNMNMNPSIFDKPKEFYEDKVVPFFKEDVPEFYEDKVVPFFKEDVPYFFNPPSEIPNKPGGSLPQVKEDDVIVPETGGAGITTIPTDMNAPNAMGGKTTTDTDIENETVTKEDLKNASTEIQKNTGNEGKKKAPEWAIPLMSAGFAMMASNSPNFLTAMGEGGQKGLETLTSINKAKLDDELTSAQAAYYRGEGRSTGKETVEGGFRGEFKNGIFVPYKDQQGNLIKATVTREDAINMLMKDDGFKNLLAQGEDGAVEREQYIENFMNMLNNTQVNSNPGVTKEPEGSIWNDLGEMIKRGVMGGLNAKDGGLATLKRR